MHISTCKSSGRRAKPYKAVKFSMHKLCVHWRAQLPFQTRPSGTSEGGRPSDLCDNSSNCTRANACAPDGERRTANLEHTQGTSCASTGELGPCHLQKKRGHETREERECV